MPLGFTPGSLLGIQRHYGDQLLAGIEKGGQIIEQGLKQITTKRQLEGLGQTLSQISPESSDYPQQLIQIGSQFPFAMQDPRGQAMMSIGVQAHNQWQQQQRAIQQSNLMFNRQKEMEGIRHQNRLGEIAARPRAVGDELIDIDVTNGLPRRDGPLQPPSRAAMVTTPEENVPLFGMTEGLGQMSPAERAKVEFAKLGPKATRKGLERATIANIGADERREIAAENQKAIGARAEANNKIRQEQLDFKKEADQIKQEFAVEKFDYSKVKDKIGVLQKQRDNMVKMLENSKKAGKTGPGSDAEEQLKAVVAMDTMLGELAGLNGKKPLDKETAEQLRREAGGDLEAARELARQRGYTF